MGNDMGDKSIGGEHATNLVSDYIDGALPLSEQERVRTHIAACQDCRSDYIELKAVQQMLHGVPMEAPPHAFTLTQEMVGSSQAQPRSFLARLLAPTFAPRLAAGSVLAFALLLLVIASAPGKATLTMSSSALQSQPAYNAAPGSATGPADKILPTVGVASDQAYIVATSTPEISAMSAAAPTDTTAAAAASGQSSVPMMATQMTPTLSPGGDTSGGQSGASSIINTPPPTSNLPPIVASGNSSPTTVAVSLPSAGQANTHVDQAQSSGSANGGNAFAALVEVVLGLLGIALAAGAVVAWQRRF